MPRFSTIAGGARSYGEGVGTASIFPGSGVCSLSVMNAERDVLVYVTSWCGACRSARRFLDEQGIPYRTIDIDVDEEAAARVMAINQGNRSVPTIVIDGEHALTEPTPSELAMTFRIET